VTNNRARTTVLAAARRDAEHAVIEVGSIRSVNEAAYRVASEVRLLRPHRLSDVGVSHAIYARQWPCPRATILLGLRSNTPAPARRWAEAMLRRFGGARVFVKYSTLAHPQ
jgi:hypothetical protein